MSLRPGEPHSGAHPAEMPQLNHAKGDSLVDGNQRPQGLGGDPADPAVWPSVEVAQLCIKNL